MFEQPGAAVVSPAVTPTQCGAAPLRHVADKSLTVFGWCANRWRSFVFPVREFASELPATTACTHIPDTQSSCICCPVKPSEFEFPVIDDLPSADGEQPRSNLVDACQLKVQ